MVEPGAGGEVPNRARDEGFTGTSKRSDSSADMDAYSSHIMSRDFHFPGMNSGSDLQPNVLEGRNEQLVRT